MSLGAFALTLLQAASSAGLEVRYIGNAALEITDGRTTLLTDFPYQSGAFGYMTYDGRSVTPAGAVISLITHRHLDHFDPALFRDRDWRIIGPAEVTAAMPPERVIGLDSVIEFGSLSVHPVRTPHANVEHYSYLVSWHGIRIYLTGDTETADLLLAQRNLDLAVITPWLWSDVRRQGRSLDARRVVIYHHRADEAIRDCGGCWIPKSGERLSLPAAARDGPAAR